MEFNNVVKSFGDVTALKGISFTIPSNSIFGLLGPNGAGKTTLIRIITKIFGADSGEIIFNGKNIRNQKYNNIGYMPEEKGLYKKMKVGEQLIYLAQLKGLSKQQAKQRIEYWFERLEIKDWWNRKVEDLSKGMQQKAQFIATVLHEPELLILDEPFSGLDPINSGLIKNEIYNLHRKGVTIIFSTHRMEQVEEICNNIALINKGNVILNGEVKEIKNEFRENKYLISFNGPVNQPENNLFTCLEKHENKVIMALKENVSRNMLLQFYMDNGNEINSFNEILPAINDIFIKLVKEDTHA